MTYLGKGLIIWCLFYCATTTQAQLDTLTINNLNILAYNLGGNDSAKIYADSALHFSRQLKWQKGIAMAEINLGNFHQSRGLYDISLSFYQKALSEAKEVNDQLTEARAMASIGNNYLFKGDPNTAFENFQKAFEVFKQLNDTARQITMLNSIGNIYNLISNSSLAIGYYQRSYDLAKEAKIEKLQANPLNNIGTVYLNLQTVIDNSRALSYLNKALEITYKYEELSDLQFKILGNLGVILMRQKKYEAALKTLNIVRERSKNSDDSLRTILNIGSVYLDSGNFEEARLAFQNVFNIAESNNMQQVQAKSLYDLALLAYRINSFKEVEINARKAISIAEMSNELDVLKDNWELLYRIYDKQNNSSQAYTALKIYTAYRDTIETNKKDVSKRESEFYYKNELEQQKKVEEQNELLLKDEISKQVLLKQIFLFVTIVSLAWFTILTLVLFYRRKKVTQKNIFAKLFIEGRNITITLLVIYSLTFLTIRIIFSNFYNTTPIIADIYNFINIIIPLIISIFMIKKSNL